MGDVSAPPTTPSALLPISASHFLAKWAFQMWDFVVPLALFFLFPSSLAPAAIILFANTLACIAVGSIIGAWIDRTERLLVIRVGLASQNLSILCSGVLVLLLFLVRGQHPDPATSVWATWQSVVLFGLLIASCMLGDLAGMTLDISVERDWVPICLSNQLTRANAWMARLDLVAETFAPICVALIVGYASKSEYTANFIAFIIVAVWNWVTAPVEYVLLRRLYTSQPDLQTNKSTSMANSEETGTCHTIAPSWELFSKQSIAIVILANACLYMTVTSPHNPLLTQFLLDWKLPVLAVSLFRASGAIFGVAATFTFPIVVEYSSLVFASGAHVFVQGIALLGALGTFIAGEHLNGNFKFLFLVFIVLSRIGLYGFCIGYVEHLQTGINKSCRGRVNAIEKALAKFAELLIYGASIVFATSEQFQFIIYISTGAVLLATVLYISWASSRHGRAFQSSSNGNNEAPPGDNELLLVEDALSDTGSLNMQ